MYIVHGATWWLQIYRIVRNLHPIINCWGLGYIPRYAIWECTDQGNDFELIPTMKMETRLPVEIQFGREYAAICYHWGVMAAWSRQNWKIFQKFFRFLEKRPLMIKFSKFCLESLHRDTDRRCCVQNSWKLSNGKSVKACVIYLTKKTFFWSLTVVTARIAPKVCHIWLTTFQISSKSVHFQRSYSRPCEGRSKCAIKHFQVLGEA